MEKELQKHSNSDRNSEEFNIFQIKGELTGGQLRWLASFLAILNFGLLVYSYFDTDELAIYFPITLTGNIAFAMLILSLFVWTFLAIRNWISWFRPKI